jgi:hypothetical protein
MKVVTPDEIGLTSLCLTNYNKDTNNDERRAELEFFDEARDKARTRMMKYQRWFSTSTWHLDIYNLVISFLGKSRQTTKVGKLDLFFGKNHFE